MTQYVFISYSNKDKPVADAICANLEAAGIRCWIKPRDIMPGEDWSTAITRAISQSSAMVLVLSANSNSSGEVSQEFMFAAGKNLVIIPFKIEDIEPEPGKQYYLARKHWIDASNPPTREQLLALTNAIRALLLPANLAPATDLTPMENFPPEERIPASMPRRREPNWFQRGISRLAGDPSTDAPPPVDKKKR